MGGGYTPQSDADADLTVTQVAALIGKKYAKARDMMLQRKFGAPQYAGRTLTVKASGVQRWLETRKVEDLHADA